MKKPKVLVTGGCGYVGSILVPMLLDRGYEVRVLDALLFGNHFFLEAWPGLQLVQGDIRDRETVQRALEGMDGVIHLAAIANDPSADLDPALTREVNLDAVLRLVEDARKMGIRRFVNASTATVYGVREETDVDETFEHRPITLYGKYKSETDSCVASAATAELTTVNLRAATVCGWSPRMRLDLTVNLLTYQGSQGKITVFGGQQMRPNIVIDDLARAYLLLLEAPADRVSGQSFNVGAENLSVLAIASLIRQGLDLPAELVIEPVFDHRSYHISSAKIRDTLGFAPSCGVLDGARQVLAGFRQGRIPSPEDTVYRNVQHMKRLDVQAGVPAA